MDALNEDPEILLKELSTHLSSVSKSPQTTKLDEDLLKRTERSLDATTSQKPLWTLLETGESLLQVLQQDPSPLTRLLSRVVQLIPFDDLKSAITPSKLEEGLSSASPAIQLLCLAYLSKAASLPSGAAFVAANHSLVARLLITWLASESTEVADTSLTTIVSLLAVDLPRTSTILQTTSTSAGSSGSAKGQGLFWRRLFHDADIYSLFFVYTSLIPTLSRHPIATKKGHQAATITQARLFDFLVRTAALDWAAITTSTLPDTEKLFVSDQYSDSSPSQPYGGLLRYAASAMIDPSDYLMDVLRRDFFVQLLGVVSEQSSPASAPPPPPPLLLKAIKDDAGVLDEPENHSEGVHL